MACASASLRTTCRWTWLLAGTSITTSASTRAEQERRRPSANGTRREKRRSGSLNGDRLALDEITPCLANSPSATKTWQRPHSPRPPQTESMSTPRLRAACSRGVPTGKFPRLPEGVNTTRGSRGAMRYALPRSSGPAAMTTFAAPPRSLPGGCRCRCAGAGARGRIAKASDPARAVGIVAQHDVCTHAGSDDLYVQRIGDRGSHAGAHSHRQERTVDAIPVRQPEADVRSAAGGIDLEFGAQPVHQAHDLHT